MSKSDKENKLNDFSSKQKLLKQHFEDLGYTPISSYTQTQEKKSGASTGFIGANKKATYMFKPSPLNLPNKFDLQKQKDKADVTMEYIFSPLFKRILFDQAPVIGLATDSLTTADANLYIKSKFVDNFQTIKDARNFNVEPKLNGIEKVLITCLFLGDHDYHHQNLGIASTAKSYDISETTHVVKVDHGKAGFFLKKPKESYIRALLLEAQSSKEFKYKLKFDKIKKAVETINTLSDAEIETLIKLRVESLKNTHFKLSAFGGNYGKYDTFNQHIDGYKIKINPTSLAPGEIGLSQQDTSTLLCKVYEEKESLKITKDKIGMIAFDILTDIFNHSSLTKRSQLIEQSKNYLVNFMQNAKYGKSQDFVQYDQLETFLIDKLKLQKSMFKELSNSLDTISTIAANQNLNAENILIDIGSQDPIIWAAQKKYNIEGEHPIIWAAKKKYNIEGEHPIFYAIKTNNIQTLRYLISQSDYVNQQSADGKTPLMYVIEKSNDNTLSVATKKDYEDIKVLIETKHNEIEIVNQYLNKENSLALMIKESALKNYHYKMFKLLLDKGADVNAKDNKGMTPLMWAIRTNANIKTITLLLDKGADINAKDNKGLTPLMWAAQRCYEKEVMENLLNKGADINVKDNLGRTALMWAAKESIWPDIVKILLDRGADAAAKDNKGNTALRWQYRNALVGQEGVWEIMDLIRNKQKESNAATKIQALVRGTKVRNIMQKIKNSLSAKENINSIPKTLKSNPIHR